MMDTVKGASSQQTSSAHRPQRVPRVNLESLNMNSASQAYPQGFGPLPKVVASQQPFSGAIGTDNSIVTGSEEPMSQ